ncbi:MAG: lycopene cyclase domain-containing protein [Verrucomicrobiota bacterium]
MSYLLFHFVFILPVIFAVTLLRREAKKPDIKGAVSGTVVLAAIAFTYTTPWDNYLVASGVWYYGSDRVIESAILGYVPVEEYLFFILQPILTAGFLLWYLAKSPQITTRLKDKLERRKPAYLGCALFLGLTAIAAGMLLSGNQQLRYLALILVWACPVLAFQWAYGGGTLYRLRRVALPAILAPTAYLCVVDMIALKLGIWVINPATSTGIHLYLLPLEEGLFFLLTNLLVVQGLLLYYQFMTVRAAQKAPAVVRRPSEELALASRNREEA